MSLAKRLWMILFGLLILGGGITGGGWELSRLSINQGYSPEQPIAFSHKIHAGDNKVPCLYCHYAARKSRHAGIPSVSVCMNCHTMLRKQTVEIEKFKEAVQQQRPIVWTKVHNLPDFVYFNHSQHVLSKVACQRCHGPIETMDRVKQASPLTMGWCLECHREHAGIATSTLKRSVASLKESPKPVAGLDCGKCHY
jgi:hypothetical protein